MTQGTAYPQTKKSHLEVVLLMQSKLEVRVVAAKDGSCRDTPVTREENKSRWGSGLGLCAEHLLPSATHMFRARSGGLQFSSQQKKESTFTCMTTNDKCIENEFSTWSHSPVRAQSGPCDVKIDIPAVKWKLQWHKTVILKNCYESLACEYSSSDTTQEIGSLSKLYLSRKP